MKKLILYSLFFFSLHQLHAQHDTTMGPHNGRLHSAGSYRIEVIGCNDFIEIYLFKRNMDPLNIKGASGDVKYYYPGEVFTSVPITPYGADGFTASIPNKDFMYGRLTAMVDGMPVSIKFENVCVATPGRQER